MDFTSVGFALKTGLNTQFYANEAKTIFPIHMCTNEMKETLRKETHHYCGIFTNDILATLPSTIYVAKNKYDVHKHKRILISSYDGKLNLWQCCPSFFSTNNYLPGTPIIDAKGNVVSIVTGRKNGHYAISSFDGYSGKFETMYDWNMVTTESGIVYGNKIFRTREDLRDYLENRKFGTTKDLQAILVNAPIPRIILFDRNSGLEVAHIYVRGDFSVDVAGYDI